MKIILTYDTDAPLNRRCILTTSEGQKSVVANFDLRFDYLKRNPKNTDEIRVVEEVHIGAWGNAKDRKYREQKVVESIKAAGE